MTEEEFLKLINDFVRGQLCGSDNWRYNCFSMMTKTYRESGRMEISILFKPYKVEKGENNDGN